MDTAGLNASQLAVYRDLLQKGNTPEHAIELITNADLSFTAKKQVTSLTETYRTKLKKIASSIDINMNSLLGMLSIEQLAAVVKDHAHLPWTMPGSAHKVMYLTGITKTAANWRFEFEVTPHVGHIYSLNDLDIQDVLGLMCTIENNLVGNIYNKFYDRAS